MLDLAHKAGIMLTTGLMWTPPNAIIRASTEYGIHAVKNANIITATIMATLHSALVACPMIFSAALCWTWNIVTLLSRQQPTWHFCYFLEFLFSYLLYYKIYILTALKELYNIWIYNEKTTSKYYFGILFYSIDLFDV